MRGRRSWFFFFFQAEDGIRDYKVTGVQTCALPISGAQAAHGGAGMARAPASASGFHSLSLPGRSDAPRLEADSMVLDVEADTPGAPASTAPARSEEHTSELQSPCNIVCRLLLEKK